MRLSSVIMRWVVNSAPSKRREWAEAMAAEFAMLTRGRLAWALGCVPAAIGWWIREDLVFMVAVVVGALFAEIVVMPRLSLIEPDFDANSFSGKIALYAFVELGPVAVVALLSCLRKDRVILTAILFDLTILAYAYLYVWPFIFHRPGRYIHWADLPPVVGEIFLFLVCLFGSALGGGLRNAFSRRKAVQG